MLLREPDREPFFILDNGLNPHIARVMAELGHPIRSVQEEFNNPSGAIEDPVIINHIAKQYGFRSVWITRDISSRRQHIELIKSRRISVVWIRRQDLSTLQQHRIITYGLTSVTQDLLESSYPIHYLVTFQGQANRERITYKQQWHGRNT